MWGTAEESESVTVKASTASLLALVCSTVLALSPMLTWTSVNIGSGSDSYTLLQIPFFPILFGLGVAVVIGSAVVALAGAAGALQVTGAAAAAITVVVVFFLVFAEAWSAIVPAKIPYSAAHFALGSGAGPGAWLALVAAAAIAVLTTPSWRARTHSLVRGLWLRGPAAVLALAGLAVGVAVLIGLRQDSWLVASALGGELSFSGDGLPWLGRVAYFAPWVLAAGVAFAFAGLLELGALVAALAGWLASVAAVVTIGCAEALVSIPVRDAHATTAAWLALAAGLLVAVLAAVLLRWGGEAA